MGTFSKNASATARVFAVAALMTTAACGGGGGGTTATAPTPTPTPTPPATPPDSITIAGAAKTATAIDTLTTRSGHWKFSDLGAVGDSHAYLWKLDENAAFVRVMICRRAFTVEAGDGSALSLQDIPVAIVNRGISYSWALKVAQGSCRVMQNMEPVALNAAWLREAVAANRIPAYKRERAFFPAMLPTLALDPQRGAYDPSSLGPIPGSSATPNSGTNYVGVTSAQGGEYTASRSFIHSVDAQVVDAAIHSEDASITTFTPEFTQYTWYSLAQPQGGVWSTTNNVTVDPQFPQTGDRPYEVARAASRTRTDIDSVIPADDWSRDESHLENTAFVHWIMTEDPVVGMTIQRQLAYHLGNVYESDRPNPQPGYMIQMVQERGGYNALSALWKSRDVTRRVTSTNGTVIWSAAKMDRMVTESFANIGAQVLAFPYKDIATITGAVFRSIDVLPWATRSGGQIYYALESNFQGFGYGKEPMWLWTKDGNAQIATYFKAKARQATVRALYIGGALGVDRAEDIAGSSLPLGPSTTRADGSIIPAPTPFATDVDWANWVKVQPIAVQSTTSFDQAALHYTVEMREMLVYAKDANLGVPEIDAAIAKMDADRGRTTAFGSIILQMHKHLGGPPD